MVQVSFFAAAATFDTASVPLFAWCYIPQGADYSQPYITPLDAPSHADLPKLVNDLLRDLSVPDHAAYVIPVPRDLLVADVLRSLDVAAIPPLERVTLYSLEAADAAPIAEAAPALRPLIARVQGRRFLAAWSSLTS